MEVCSDAPAPADKRRQKTKCNGGSAAWIRRRPHRTANNQQENGKERENLKTLCSARHTHKFKTKPSKLITISSSLQIIIIIMLAWKGRAKRVRARKLLPSVFSVEHQRIKNCCFSCASSVGCCVASAIISSFIQETRRLSVSEHAVAGIILVYFFLYYYYYHRQRPRDIVDVCASFCCHMNMNITSTQILIPYSPPPLPSPQQTLLIFDQENLKTSL